MNNPFAALLKAQIAFTQGWYKLAADAFLGYERLMSHQLKMFEHSPYLRMMNLMARGADLSDHYGKRHSDVDVNRV